MQDPPSAPDLLDIAAKVLRSEIVPALDGPAAYHARIAASLVAMVARELRSAPAAQAAEGDRLRALLASDKRDLSALNAVLAAQLRAGTLAIGDAPVLRHLRRTVLDKLAIDNPASARLHQVTRSAGDAIDDESLGG